MINELRIIIGSETNGYDLNRILLRQFSVGTEEKEERYQ
jgi:hypothetical protein